MEAPKVRLSTVLADFSKALDRILEKDRANVRKAFDAAVLASSSADGACDGLKLFERVEEVLAACPDGPVSVHASQLMQRLREERNYRGEDWCRLSLGLTLREGVKAFGEPPAAPKKGKAEE